MPVMSHSHNIATLPFTQPSLLASPSTAPPPTTRPFVCASPSTVPPPLPVTLVSFNVGLRGLEGTLSAAFGGSLSGLLAALHNPDILCLQETKLTGGRLPTTRDSALAAGYSSFFSNARSGSAVGRHGVAIIVRDGLFLPVLAVEEGLTGALYAAGVSFGGLIDGGGSGSVGAGGGSGGGGDRSGDRGGDRGDDTAGGDDTDDDEIVICDADDDEIFACGGDVTDDINLIGTTAPAVDAPAHNDNNHHYGGSGEDGSAAATTTTVHTAGSSTTHTTLYTPLELDSEGRALFIDLGPIVISSIYAPAGAPGRFPFKAQFHAALSRRVKGLLAAGRHVVILGDLNVSHRAIDVADPASRADSAAAFKTHATRMWMDRLLTGATVGADARGEYFVDAFRHFHPARTGAFTCWEEKSRARLTNFGSRLDYALFDARCSDAGAEGEGDARGAGGAGAPVILSSDIWPLIMGSDHCPIILRLQLPASTVAAARAAAPPATMKLPHVCSANAAPSYAGHQRSIRDALAAVPVPALPLKQSNISPPPSQLPPPPSPSPYLLPPAASSSSSTTMAAASSVDDGGAGGVKAPHKKSQKRARANTVPAPPSLIQPSAPKIYSFFGGKRKVTTAVAVEVVEVIEITSSGEEDDVDAGADAEANMSAGAGADAGANADAPAAHLMSQATFRALFTGPEVLPQCLCDCITVKRTVREGANQGRDFFVCAKPKGKYSDGGSCDFFRWAV